MGWKSRKQRLRTMNNRERRVLLSNIIRGSKYSLVSIISFGMEKAILALGLFLFGTVYIIPINVAAVFFSVALGFFANESWTVWHEGDHSAMWKGILARLLKFEIIYAAGSAVGIIIQLLIFHRFGNNYVWRIKVWRQ